MKTLSYLIFACGTIPAGVAFAAQVTGNAQLGGGPPHDSIVVNISETQLVPSLTVWGALFLLAALSFLATRHSNRRMRGAGLAGLLVAMSGLAWATFSQTTNPDASTGDYAFNNVPPGAYLVEITAPGHFPRSFHTGLIGEIDVEVDAVVLSPIPTETPTETPTPTVSPTPTDTPTVTPTPTAYFSGIVSFSGNANANNLSTGTWGYAFSLDCSRTVTALGFYDLGGNGLDYSHEVGVYTSGGVLKASTTIPAGTEGFLVNGFRFVPITPVVLTAGNYRIGAHYLTSQPEWTAIQANPPTTYSGFTIGQYAVGSGTSLAFPNILGTFYQYGVFGPNLLFSQAPPCP